MKKIVGLLAVAVLMSVSAFSQKAYILRESK